MEHGRTTVGTHEELLEHVPEICGTLRGTDRCSTDRSGAGRRLPEREESFMMKKIRQEAESETRQSKNCDSAAQ